MLAKGKLNFVWYSRVSAITSALIIFLGAVSVSHMIKQHNSRLLTTIFCYSLKNTSALFGDSAIMEQDRGRGVVIMDRTKCTEKYLTLLSAKQF